MDNAPAPLSTAPVNPPPAPKPRSHLLSNLILFVLAITLVSIGAYIYFQNTKSPSEKTQLNDPTSSSATSSSKPSFADTTKTTDDNTNQPGTVKLAVFGGDHDNCASTTYVERSISPTSIPLQEALKLLLTETLTAEEKSKGFRNPLTEDTDFPKKRITLEKVVIVDGVATITVNDPQNLTTGGSCRVGIMSTAIENTAKQFASVKEVIILPDLAFEP